MLSIASLVVTACLAISNDSGSYSEAFNQAKSQKQPLLVLVGATWCPACRTMEQQVLPRLNRQGRLSGVSFAKVDTDQQPELARQLMRGSAIPQLIVFSQRPDGTWYREQLTGSTSEASVLSLIERASAQMHASGPRSVSAIGN